MRCFILTLLIATALSTGAAPLGTEFTYQGTLSVDGAPADGAYDLRFILYDAAADGTQVGAPVYVEDANVSQGRVTVRIDFGAVFDGTALWLDVGVRDGAATGAFTVLSPRQPLTAGPYAVHAMDAETCGVATDADLLDGQEGSYYRAWSSLTGVPLGLSDGDDDTLADLSCEADQVARWTGSSWSCSDDTGVAYARTYVVSPVGSQYQNGAALVAAAMAIPPPGSAEEAVLLRIEPGVYHVAGSPLPIWGHMAVEGAGEAQTKIIGNVCSGDGEVGTIQALSDFVELRHLTVENVCTANFSYSVALYIAGSDSRVSNVTFEAEATAQRNIGIATTGSAVSIHHSTVLVHHGINRGIGISSSGDELSLFDVVVSAGSGTAGSATGIQSSGNDLRLEHVRVIGYGGAANCSGVSISEGADFTLIDVETGAYCGHSSDYGFYSENGHGTMYNVKAVGARGIFLYTDMTGTFPVTLREVEVQASNEGIYLYEAGGTLQVRVLRSLIWGAGNAVFNQDSSAIVHIGGCFLEGGPVSGSAVCRGSYRNNVWSDESCP